MKNPAAVALGKIKSRARAKASRENGKLGGRPKKTQRAARRANAPRELPPTGDSREPRTL